MYKLGIKNQDVWHPLLSKNKVRNTYFIHYNHTIIKGIWIATICLMFF